MYVFRVRLTNRTQPYSTLNFLFYSAPVSKSEDVCRNIRNVKLKFYFFPEMRLYQSFRLLTQFAV